MRSPSPAFYVRWREIGAALITLSLLGSSRAEEGGTGHHLSGSGVSLTGILPGEPGLTAKTSNWLFFGDVSASRSLGSLVPDQTVNNGVASFVSAALGGNLPPIAQNLAEQVGDRINDRLDDVDVDVTVDSVQNISTLSLLYVTPWKLFGGRYTAGVALPFAAVKTTVTLEVEGPQRKASRTVSESAFGFSDLVVLPVILGWDRGYFHWTTGLGIYAPTGSYSPDDLAPLGKGYWSFEPFAGFTFLHEKSGQEISIGAAWDVNTTNPQTNYRSGDQLNVEWLIAQHLPRGFSVGATGYYYQQISGDSDSGATNGAFRARSVAIGPTLGFVYQDKLAVNAQWFYEVAAENNFQGNVISVNAS